MNKLEDIGIGTQVHYIPVTHHPFYQQLGYESKNYTNSLSFYDKCLSLPLYYSLSDEDQDFVIDKINGIINQ